MAWTLGTMASEPHASTSALPCTASSLAENLGLFGTAEPFQTGTYIVQTSTCTVPGCSEDASPNLGVLLALRGSLSLDTLDSFGLSKGGTRTDKLVKNLETERGTHNFCVTDDLHGETQSVPQPCAGGRTAVGVTVPLTSPTGTPSSVTASSLAVNPKLLAE